MNITRLRGTVHEITAVWWQQRRPNVDARSILLNSHKLTVNVTDKPFQDPESA